MKQSLEAPADITAKDLLEPPEAHVSQLFRPGQLRTLQRWVKRGGARRYIAPNEIGEDLDAVV